MAELTQEEIKKYRVELGLDPETAQPVRQQAPSSGTPGVPATRTGTPSADDRIKALRAGAAPVPKQDGILKSIAKDLVTPFARAGVSAYNIASGAGQLFQAALAPKGARQDFLNKAYDETTKTRYVPGLGDLSAVGSQDSTSAGIKDILGTGLQIGSTIVGGGEAKGALTAGKTALRTTIGQSIKAGLRYGGVTGAAYTAGNDLTQNKDVGETLLDTAGGAIGGGVLGAGVGAVTPLISRYATPFVKNLIKGVEETATSKPGVIDKTLMDVTKAQKDSPGFVGKLARRIDNYATGNAEKKALSEAEQQAISSGLDKADVNFISTSNPADKKDFSRMLDLQESGAKNRRVTTQAKSVAGETIMSRVDHLEKANEQVGSAIRDAVDKMPTKALDITPAYDDFVKELDRSGINVKADGTLDFRNSRIAGSTGNKDRELLQTLHDDLRPSKTGQVLRDPKRIFRIRQKFFDELNLASENKQISGAEGIISRVRTKLAEPLDALGEKLDTNYAANRHQYAETESALTDFYKLMGKKWTGKIGGNADLRAAEVASRVLGNASAVPLEVLQKLEDTAGKFGFKDGKNVVDQLIFSDFLENVFGTSQTRSLRGQVARGTGDAITEAMSSIPTSATGAAVAATKKVVNYANKKTPEEAIFALRKLLK